MTTKRSFALAGLCMWLVLLVLVVQPAIAQEPEPPNDGMKHAAWQRPQPDKAFGGWETDPRQTPDGLWYMPEGAEPRMHAAAPVPQDTGGPDDFGYTWDDTVPVNWIDASGGMDTGIDSDTEYTGAIDIGFPFKYYENTYDYLYISRHGFLSFNDDDLWNGQSEVPSTEKPDDVIAPHWTPSDDVGYVRYLHGGTAPDRWFVVEWNQLLSGHDGVDEYTFESILYENGDILFQYGAMDTNGGYWCQSSGIEDSSGLDGLAVTDFCNRVEGYHAVKIARPAPSARVGIRILHQGNFTRAGDTSTYQITIRNTGEFGTDTYDITQTSSWPAALFHAGSMTPLSDTNGDGNVDTGPVDQGHSRTIIAQVQAPAGASVGAHNEVALMVRSALNSNQTKNVSLRTTVPSRFAQVYRDNANGAMGIDYVAPDVRFSRNATDNWHWGYNVAVTELTDKNMVYLWSKGRRISDDPFIYVREIEYTILGPTGEIVRPVTRLTDHSSATISTYDYDPAVAVAPNGRIGILWYRYRYEENSGENNYNIYFATLESDGELIGTRKNITNNDEWGRWDDLHVPRMSDPQIAATSENHFILAWRQFHYGDPNDDCSNDCGVADIWYAIRRSSGSEKKGPKNLTNDAAGWEDGFYNPSLTSANGMHALLTFSRDYDGDIYYVAIHSQGNIVKAMTNLSQDAYNTYDFRPDAVQLSDGRIVVAWYGWRYPQHDMHFAVLDDDYNRIVAPTVLANPAAVTGDGYVSVAADDSARAVLTWMDYDYDNRRNLYYALVDGSGSVLTPATIFRTSERQNPYIETSFQGYGNTSYSWRPEGVDASLTVSDETLTAAPDSIVGFGIQYANQGATASGVTLEATLDPNLAYHNDSSGVTPTVSDNMVTWLLPDLRLFEERGFDLHLQVTGGAPGGVLPVHLELSSNEPDLNPDDNVATVQVKVFRKLFLPLVMKKVSSSCPVVPTLISPADESNLNTINPLFTYDTGDYPGITYSRLEVATDPDFALDVSGYWMYPSVGINSLRFARNFDPATRYYWRAWLICGDIDGEFSTVWSFTTGSNGTILQAPVQVAPDDESTLESLPVSLQWSTIAGVEDYIVRWRKVGQSRTTFRWVTGTETEIEWLEADTTYEWWVSARNDYAIGTESEIWQFTTPADASSTSSGSPQPLFGVEENHGDRKVWKEWRIQ